MPVFTLETTYRLPIFRHRNIEAPTLEEACRLAIEDDDWSGERQDYETAGATYVSGAWPGADAAYSASALPVPSHFHETVQRRADHFDELAKQLEHVAQPMGLPATDFEHWLTGARAAVEKAGAIAEGRRDPDPDDPVT